MGKKIQCIGRYVMDGQTLGKGNFAKVELATHGLTCCKVAIKIIDTRKIKEDYTRNNLHREARILGQIRHPHIIRLYETLKATTLYCLVLEYASGGDLLAFIKNQKEGRLLENKARPFFRQLVSAIHFLHERGVAHRDLKMENILLDGKHKNLKVIDFGLSNTFSRNELMKTHCGSLEYAAPELIANNDNKYGPEVDIWSLGLILYGMVLGKLPFSTHYTDQYRRQKLLVQILKGLSDNHFKELTLHGISEELIDLLNKLIEPSVELRLPLADCEIHSWFTNNNKLPFTPFIALPRDKTSKLQVIDELAALLETPREHLEDTVQENKCDDYSAMFNMLLDTKRMDKGLFDTDFTQKQEVKREKHKKRHHHRHASKKDSKGKATPSILCPEIEIPSDTEEPKVPQSHNSTSFDLMALCSAPTWLGGDRRKSRRRRSPMPVSPLPPSVDPAKNELDPGALAAVGGQEPHGLLSPTQASTQVAQLLRRNSSRRKSRRSVHSADPPSRTGSIRRSRRHHNPDNSGSNPNSPHSPNNPNNPEIKIDTPKQSPVSAVKRPANLKGLKECYSNDNHKGLTRKSTLGPNTSYSRRFRRTRFGSDKTDGGDSMQSDSSNPCSTTNLHEDYSDGSQDEFSRHGSKTSLGSVDNRESTVESRIAHADIRSIVRPKQIVLRSKVNGQVKRDNPCSLHVPNVEDASCRSLSASPEIIIESMQSSTFANLSDDEKLERRMSCEIPKTDSEKRVEQELTDSLHVNLQTSDSIHSSTECLGAASLKPEHYSDYPDAGLHDETQETCRLEFYANDHELSNPVNRNILNDTVDHFETLHEPKHLVADLYSKREKISLDDKILMQDDICYVDSSDHNSSQENLILDRRRRKESLDDIESISAPILLSPRELGLGLTPSESPGDSLIGPGASSVLSSRHGSTPSVRFVMPSTPIRQMFHTPIARIESFHSDDFEIYTSDIDALVTSPTTPSPSSISTQTPTVPCFQYRIHGRKKQFMRKSAKHQQKSSKDNKKFQKDGIISFIPEKNGRDDFRGREALVSSSSECGSDGQVPEVVNASKAKIFPMENSDDQTDGKSCKPQMNDKTKLISEVQVDQNSTKKHQNSTCRSFPWKQAQDTETKQSIWRRGFVHLLKKKKLTSFGSGNNNNDADSPSRYRVANHSNSSTANVVNTVINTRNGHARGSYRAVPPSTLDIPATSVEIKWSPAKVVQNNIKAGVDSGTGDIGRTQTPSPSPSKPKVFDFTIVTSEPSKHKHCLLSWKACRECTFSEDSSTSEVSEDNDGRCSRDSQIPESTNSNTIAMTTIRAAPVSPCNVSLS
ncbi:uncharacterized protein LOC132716543 isoform X3 [Ruditapes philippinarum]|uniref:uncharacterized protein LOC132716543 isoform X3 n=1 Tax=Ruditapes philippinarum TaxID=129788 RepID=UPI00295B002C|nr:uncharacterized protein LOC132716543 isoform X3 [Ruditapes philippinarum]